MRPHRLLAGLTALAACAAITQLTGPTLAAFSTSTATQGTMSAKGVFAGTRSWPGWDLRDASSGTEANASDAKAFSGVTATTKTWATAWGTTRYLTYDMNSPLPAGVATSGVTLNFDFADSNVSATTQVCFYFEVLLRSTSAVIGTHGSTASPVACEPTTTIHTTSTPLPEVTTSDIADDLRIKVYAMRTTTAGTMLVDRAVVSGSSTVAPFTLYETSSVDAANAVVATTPWSIATADATAYQEATNWPAAFNTARYLKVTFPTYLPASATVTSAQLVHTFRPAVATTTACYYLDVLSGATVIATYGSAVSPYCATGAAYTTNTILTPALNTAARVNGAIVRLYVRTSTAGRTLHDLFRLDVGYSVD
jgi:hypothetical protein